ncbi:metallophosphoesterase [Mycobacterium sp. M1]|uniref:Metallophosphoesterase n=1 Tax=Mycolicibacter acidiphilus TaxID=2835306 RepID=A0ABS5RMH2_9MYCO|nr:metallophosphoesterase [Mycolicibacter acidiphilus]MBS9535490.1 metallophosphoesterase [Mycolicibacter acidiphilus]
MPQNTVDGYDIIGDIHGCADELTALLELMDYRPDGYGVYRHPGRTAVFVGDLIDRGPQQLEVLKIVRGMVDVGSALMVLGNHEFNALAYHTEDPENPGKSLRVHDDPDDERSKKNEKQHAEFVRQLTDAQQREYLDWFRTQPLWLDLKALRVVHACWHQKSIDVLRAELPGDRLATDDALVRATREGDSVYEAVEILLKGPEINLTQEKYGQPRYLDKDGAEREDARMRWWDAEAATLRGVAEMSAGYKTVDGARYPALPEIPVSESDRGYTYTGPVPVFFGHYWRKGNPQAGQDYTDYTACVDFSVGKGAAEGGALNAYRWSGESIIDPEHYVKVDAVWAGASVVPASARQPAT